MSRKSKQPIKQDVSRPGAKTAPAEQTKPAAENPLLKIHGKNAMYLALGVLALMGVIVFRNFLLFNKILLYKDIGSDSVNETLPYLMHSWRYLQSYGFLSWSFNIGMGQSAVPFAFRDIFDFLLYMTGGAHIPWLLGYEQYIEVLLIGFVFYRYLITLGRTSFAALTGAMMIAFCGFVMIGLCWSFSYDALLAVLLLLGFEELFLKNRYWIFVLAVFLFGLSEPFSLTVYASFMLVYIVFRYLQENRHGLKAFGLLLLKIAGLGAIGLALAGPVLIENIKMILDSPRVGGTDSLFHALSSAPVFDLVDQKQLGTAVQRFFASDILGSGSDYKGWQNILEGPTFYCGIPCLLLTPVLFGFLGQRQIKLFGIFIGIWLVPVLFPYFRHAIWFFSGDYYRYYSLFVAMVFVYCSVLSLDYILSGKKANLKILAITSLALIAIRLFPYFDEKNVVDGGLSLAINIFIIAYAAIIYFIAVQQNKTWPMIGFLAVLAIELCWFSSVSVDRKSNITAAEMNGKTGYNDYTVETLAWLKDHNHSFYRIDKGYGSGPAVNPSLNDGMEQGYYGTSSYSSFNQRYYLQYLRAYGVISPVKEDESRWSIGLVNRQFLESLNGVKYVLRKNYVRQGADPVRDSINTIGDITIFKNKYALPLGFCYENYIRYSDFEKLWLFQKDIVSLRAAVINDADTAAVRGLRQLSLKDTMAIGSFNFQVYKRERDSLAQDSLQITSFLPYKITGQTHLTKQKLLYLSIPYDKGWHAMIDGKETAIVLVGNGMMGIMPGIGAHTVELVYKPVLRTEGELLSMVSLMVFAGLVFQDYRSRRKRKGA